MISLMISLMISKSPWMSHGNVPLFPAMRTPPRRWSWRKLLRSKSEGRQCATMSPGTELCISAPLSYTISAPLSYTISAPLSYTISAPLSYTYRMKPPFHSGFVGLAPATFEMRIPINRVGLFGGLYCSYTNCNSNSEIQFDIDVDAARRNYIRCLRNSNPVFPPPNNIPPTPASPTY